MLDIRWHTSLSSIEPWKWDRLAKPLQIPFLEWHWLNLLEKSGSVSVHTGWRPNHLTLWEGDRLAGAAPLYIKTHSQGEFVFDHVWVEVAQRMGIQYYPKLVGMSPFSPISGYRFLIDPERNEDEVTAIMIGAIHRFCRRNRLNGCQFNYVDPSWRERMATYDFNVWQHTMSFLWRNRRYGSFDEYLARFKTNQRRNIKRERGKIRADGMKIRFFHGEYVPVELFSQMHLFYEHTNDRYGPWGCKYLTASFFDGLWSSYRHRILLVAAYERGEVEDPVGMALFLVKNRDLYGRYWGCRKYVEGLHFEVCYYSPIEWAIRHRMERFDPGLGSRHKLRRGFQSIPSYSLHFFYDRRLQMIMGSHIDEINHFAREETEALNRKIPFAHRG